MEWVAWAAHKYVMHGFLWNLHADHHVKEPGFFEKNDFFFVIFALPSMSSFIIGTLTSYKFLLAIGAGILAYGIAYFLVHEIIIHRRFNWIPMPKSGYLKAVVKAHQQHHTHPGKEHGECFGMLLVPKVFLKFAKK